LVNILSAQARADCRAAQEQAELYRRQCDTLLGAQELLQSRVAQMETDLVTASERYAVASAQTEKLLAQLAEAETTISSLERTRSELERMVEDAKLQQQTQSQTVGGGHAASRSGSAVAAAPAVRRSASSGYAQQLGSKKH
jgi:chromosome segregation ATPase